MQRRGIALLLIGLLLAGGLGCGGTAAPPVGSAAPSATSSGEDGTAAPSVPSPGSPSPPADAGLDAILAAARKTVDSGTVRIDFEAEFQRSRLIPSGTGFTGEGQASFGEKRQMRFDTDLAAFGLGPIDMIVDDRLLYIRGPVVEELVGERWLLVDLDSDHPAAAGFQDVATGQNDTSLALFYLFGATGEPGRPEIGTVRGTPTRKYELAIDLESAVGQVPDSAREALEDNIAELRANGVERTIDGEVWLGEDGYVHRVRYAYSLGRQLGGGDMIAVYDLTDFGASLDLDLPEDADVVAIEEAVPEAAPS